MDSYHCQCTKELYCLQAAAAIYTYQSSCVAYIYTVHARSKDASDLQQDCMKDTQSHTSRDASQKTHQHTYKLRRNKNTVRGKSIATGMQLTLSPLLAVMAAAREEIPETEASNKPHTFKHSRLA